MPTGMGAAVEGPSRVSGGGCVRRSGTDRCRESSAFAYRNWVFELEDESSWCAALERGLKAMAGAADTAPRRRLANPPPDMLMLTTVGPGSSHCPRKTCREAAWSVVVALLPASVLCVAPDVGVRRGASLPSTCPSRVPHSTTRSLGPAQHVANLAPIPAVGDSCLVGRNRSEVGSSGRHSRGPGAARYVQPSWCCYVAPGRRVVGRVARWVSLHRPRRGSGGGRWADTCGVVAAVGSTSPGRADRVFPWSGHPDRHPPGEHPASRLRTSALVLATESCGLSAESRFRGS